MQDAAITQITDFWFGPLTGYGTPQDSRLALWFRSNPQQDQLIETRFGHLVHAALDGGLTEWEATPQGRLALIILLDQFTRNICRRTARAFAGDSRALSLCQQGIALEHDQSLPLIQRLFFYLPLEHAENRECHEEMLRLLTGLRNSAPAAAAGMAQGFLDSALEHKAVIDRFGRYPHRNAVLQRENTPEETAWLSDSGQRFGQ